MSVLALVTFIMSAAAAFFFAMRCHLLKPESISWQTAPTSTRLAVLIMAAGFAFQAQAVAVMQSASWTEAWISLCGLLYAFVMWWNLRAQAGQLEKKPEPSPRLGSAS